MPIPEHISLRTRRDPGVAAATIGRLFSRLPERRAVLRILANAIDRANRVAPASWGVSLFPHRICLNVGRGAVLQFYQEEVLLTLSGRHLRQLAGPARRLFHFNQKYRFVSDAIEGKLRSQDMLNYKVFAAAHADLIERAAQGRKICFWLGAHSPGVIQALRNSGHQVSDPDYSTARLRRGRLSAVDPDELDRVTYEGRRSLRTHLSIERDPMLAARKKHSVLVTQSRLKCEVCGFDFEQRYGSIGHGFAEVHHKDPLASSTGRRRVGLKQVAIVCSNCHRMLHRGDPVFSLTELRTRLAGRGRDV